MEEAAITLEVEAELRPGEVEPETPPGSLDPELSDRLRIVARTEELQEAVLQPTLGGGTGSDLLGDGLPE